MLLICDYTGIKLLINKGWSNSIKLECVKTKTVCLKRFGGVGWNLLQSRFLQQVHFHPEGGDNYVPLKCQ